MESTIMEIQMEKEMEKEMENEMETWEYMGGNRMIQVKLIVLRLFHLGPRLPWVAVQNKYPVWGSAGSVH